MANSASQSSFDLMNGSVFRSVADCTYDWESWLDLSGGVVWINPAVERLTGYSVSECLEMTDYPFSMVVEEDRSRVAGILRGALAGDSGNDREFRIRKKDGSIGWIAVSWQPLLDEKAQRIGIRTSMRDIRERKQMEEERLRYSQKLEELAQARAASIVALKKKKLRVEKLASLGVMAAKVAHEINNPIAGIKNAIRLVRDDAGLDQSSVSMLRLVDGEIDRIGSLLRQLYQLYRPTLASASRFDLVRSINEVLSMVSAQCEPKKIQIQRMNWPETFEVVLCEHELRQIIHNLALNAFEASEENGQVEIGIETISSSRLRIVVKDHGEGIDNEILANIFEPFVTTKQDSGRSGSGLGLAIAQSLANAIGGAIEPEHTAGGGATFVLELPLDPLDAPEATKPSESTEPPTLAAASAAPTLSRSPSVKGASINR